MSGFVTNFAFLNNSIMTAQEEKKTDAFILASTRLKSTSKEYLAVKTLLEHGNLLYCFLGKWETLDLTKIFIQMQFTYQYVTGGIQLRETSKDEYYVKFIKPKPALPADYYPNTVLAVGKMEKHDESQPGWVDKRTKK